MITSDENYSTRAQYIAEALDLENNTRKLHAVRLGYSTKSVEFDSAFLEAAANHAQQLFNDRQKYVIQDVRRRYEEAPLSGKPITETQIQTTAGNIAPKVTIVF